MCTATGLNHAGTTPALRDDGSIVFTDNETGKVSFEIPAPYMYDSNDKSSDAVHYELQPIYSMTEKDVPTESSVLKIVADADWINDDECEFPVTIDPTVLTNQNKDTHLATFVAQGTEASLKSGVDYENMVMGSGSNCMDHMLIGREYSYGACRSYVKANFDPIPKGNIIVSATINLYEYIRSFASTSSIIASAYRVTGTWAEQSLSWATQPGYDSTVIDYRYITASDGEGWKSWDVTKLVQGW